MLYAINHTNKSSLWCGPAAIAAVTGYDTATIHRVARSVCNRRRLAGMYLSELAATLQALGAKNTLHRLSGKLPTLAQWLKAHTQTLRNKTVVLVVGNHYVTVSGRYFIDNHTVDAVPLRDAPRRRARVRAVVLVESVGKPICDVSAPVKILRSLT